MSKKGIVWVTGCKGFIGGEIARRFKAAGYNVVGTDIELSVCEQERLEAFAEEIQPDVVVNCAGIRRDATNLLEYAGYDPEKVLIPAEDARTAENVVLESMMLSMAGVELPAWEDDLRSYMEEEGLLAK